MVPVVGFMAFSFDVVTCVFPSRNSIVIFCRDGKFLL